MERKKNQNIILLIQLILIIILSHQSFSQDWVEEHNDLVLRDWEINVSAGITSYFGDLSIHDFDPVNKINHESGPAFGLSLTKQLSPQIGITGQLIAGKIKAKKSNISMESSIFEYNIQLRLNLLRMFIKRETLKTNLTVFGGIGNFIFKSTKIEYFEGDDNTTIHDTRVPEFVYFFGGRLGYRINDQISVNAEISLHQFQNDKIDITVKNDDFDYFSYLSIGFSYHFRSFQKTSTIRNKARVAHNNQHRKPLDPSRYR